ncbi:MAG: hypothetical protein VKO39_05705 [Cyanobacteriota bacterium]|nr:hypothetical protein [Cyanobacteriota bacterium]
MLGVPQLERGLRLPAFVATVELPFSLPRRGMDAEPLTLILAALAAGAAAGAKETVAVAIHDSYQGFRGLLQRKLAGSAAATVVLEEHEKDPDTYAMPLKKVLLAAAVEQDAAILQAARALLEQAGASRAPQPVITQTISKVKYAATSATGDASIGAIHDHGAGPDA